MEKKKIYVAIGTLLAVGAVVGMGICYYNKKNKLPDATKIKLGADGTSDEVRGIVQKLPSQKQKEEKGQEVSNFGGHGGGGGGGHGHGGWGGRGRGLWGGWGYGFGYPYFLYDNGCYQMDRFGNMVSVICDDYDYPPTPMPILPRRKKHKKLKHQDEEDLGIDAGSIDI